MLELRKVGVVVANSTFGDSKRLPNLKYPRRDAEELAAILLDKNYGGFDRVTTALDKTHTKIKGLIEDTIRLNRDAFLLIYYAGHGKLGDDGRLFLAAKNTKVDRLYTTAIKFKDLVDIVDGYGHRRVGFVLDCCYAGAAVADLRGTTEDDVKAVTAGKQVFVLCGSSSIQTARELDRLGHGVLTAGILNGIKTGEADRDKDGVITLTDLFQFCSDFACQYSHQEPVCTNRLTGLELPIARVNKQILEKEIERIRNRITFVKENNLLDDELVYRFSRYFSGLDVRRPRKNSFEDSFVEFCADRISFSDFLKKINSDVLPSASSPIEVEPIKRRELDPEMHRQREAHALKLQEEHTLPGIDAPQFTAVTNYADKLLVRPSAYPMTPMYLLDSAFRILDWNTAFTVAFDRTMEGRKGRSVLDWTYFLDNYEDVLDHGTEVFGDGNKGNSLPPIDVESIEYTSQRYGKLSAIKRAYQIPDDNCDCLGWLVTLDVSFADQKQQNAFHRDLIRVLAADLMWSEYAMSYDRVLKNTRVYPELLDKLVGGFARVRKIPEDACIIDLGAGTGNLAHQLVATGENRLVYAAENNRMMLEMLRSKCAKFLRNDAEGGGVIALKQDITSLFGLEDDYFDFAILNNVLYSVADAEACLKEVLRVLKPGGELRLSGPRKDTNLTVLFDRIEKDLKDAKKFQELETDYRHVLQINELNLRPMLFRWSTKDVEEMLVKVGFSGILYSSEEVYAGQSMFICAVK